MELLNAIENNDEDVVIRLLNRGVDVNYQEDSQGESPLMMASRQGKKNIFDILLNAGADINLLDQDGYDALMYAVSGSRYGHRGKSPAMRRRTLQYILIVKKLLDKGINPNIRNDDNFTAYDMAMYFENIEIAELIKKYMTIYRMQALKRGNLTRRKLRTSMARRRSALNQVADEYGLNEEIIHMLNSRMIRPTRSDMIDETPRDILLQEQRENQSIADYLDDLDQYGSGKRSGLSNRRKRKKKRLYKRY